MGTSRLESRLLLPATLLALVIALIAAPAYADVGETIILRCTHNESLSGFSQSAYKQALKELSADSEEYSDCASLIQRAQLRAAGTGSGGGGASGAAPVSVTATPAEQRALVHAVHSRSAPVRVGDQVVDPGVVHANVASALSSLPTPLLALLGVLLALLLVIVASVLRNRVRDDRPG